MKIVEHYTKLLKTIGATVESDGLVKYGGSVIEAEYVDDANTVNKAKLVVPMQSDVMKEDPTRLKFHPVGESLDRGQSEVQALLVIMIRTSLYQRSMDVLTSLFNLMLNTSAKESLTLRQVQLFGDNVNIPKNLKPVFDKICKNAKHNGKFAMVNVRQERNGEKAGSHYVRMTTISSYAHRYMASEDKSKFMDIDVPPKSIPALTHALQVVFGSEPSQGSTLSDFAPYYFSLLKAYAVRLRELDVIRETLGVHYTGNEYDTDYSWFDELNQVNGWFKKELRVRWPGNKGIITRNTTEKSVADEEPERLDESVQQPSSQTKESSRNAVGQTEAETTIDKEPIKRVLTTPIITAPRRSTAASENQKHNQPLTRHRARLPEGEEYHEPQNQSARMSAWQEEEERRRKKRIEMDEYEYRRNLERIEEQRRYERERYRDRYQQREARDYRDHRNYDDYDHRANQRDYREYGDRRYEYNRDGASAHRDYYEYERQRPQDQPRRLTEPRFVDDGRSSQQSRYVTNVNNDRNNGHYSF